MYTGRIVFAQLMDYLPKHEFHKCAQRYRGNRRMRGFSCLDQFLAMAFAELTYRESLRDIETCLRALAPKLYHAGFRGPVARSTLADANERRDWRIFRDFAYVLIDIARPLYAGEDLGVDLEQTAYALDSTTIDLCLTLFPWAPFLRNKAAVKMHTLLDLRGNIPAYVVITHGRCHDVTLLDTWPIEPNAVYVMDRGYFDFKRLYRIHKAGAFFITRPKDTLRFRRRYSRPIEKATGLQCDQTIVPAFGPSRRAYPEALRRVRFRDPETDDQYVFLTNHFALTALTVAQLYHLRWRVELFFKWVKSHLRIKAFYGTSENAVKSQLWIAISVYVLVAIIKKRLGLDLSLYTILQILSLTLFEKIPLLQAFSNVSDTTEEDPRAIQLNLFDF
jgi:hypothetical protein